jgi:tetratricopeptide (TPR) repeat protein
VLSLRALRCLRGVVVTCAVLAAASARAHGPAQPEAAAPESSPHPLEVERHAALGQRLLERGQTQEAIAEFRRAYELRADPRLLYDIAEGYRQLGLRDQARFFYERYLAAAPDAPDREEVETQLAALAHEAAPSHKAPPAASPPASLARDVVVFPVSVAPDETHPLWRRWWAWTALGAVIAAGIASALLTRQNDTPVPTTALGDKRFY